MVRRILSLRALFKKLSCMFCAGFSILAPKPSRASKTVLKNGFCIVTPFVGTMPHRARLAVRDLEVAGVRGFVAETQGGLPLPEGARKKTTPRAGLAKWGDCGSSWRIRKAASPSLRAQERSPPREPWQRDVSGRSPGRGLTPDRR